jgi:hypothetical protein
MKNNVLATFLNDLTTQIYDLATYFLARSFYVCVRSLISVAITFLQHVIATKNVGNFIFIGRQCHEVMWQGHINRGKMDEKSLPNPFQHMSCLMFPLQPTAMSCLVLYFLSCLVVVLGMRVLRPFSEKYSMAA